MRIRCLRLSESERCPAAFVQKPQNVRFPFSVTASGGTIPSSRRCVTCGPSASIVEPGHMVEFAIRYAAQAEAAARGGEMVIYHTIAIVLDIMMHMAGEHRMLASQAVFPPSSSLWDPATLRPVPAQPTAITVCAGIPASSVRHDVCQDLL